MTLDPDAVWASARDLADLGELTARWLTGELPETPTNGGPPDPETVGLVPILVAFNRAGYVTEFSQPGELGERHQQRAAVAGYCSELTADRLSAALDPTDLLILAHPPGSPMCSQVAVSLYEGIACTWAGSPSDVANILHWYEEAGCSPAAIAAVLGAWQVFVIDPVWGRNDELWITLSEALGVVA